LTLEIPDFVYREGPHGEVVLSRGVPPPFTAPIRKGDWIQTFTDKQFFPLDARPEDVCLEDIAHALSNLCRFGGHVREFYSVAQHSVLVSWHCPKYPRSGLMHDATEAYLVDVPRPIKKHLSNYSDIEANLARVIGARFALPLSPLPAEVQEADERALATEKRDLRGPPPAAWGDLPAPWFDTIVPWVPSVAKEMFLNRAAQLGVK
jgi:hypothetical protein